MIKVVETEKQKMAAEWQSIKEAKEKVREKRQNLKEDKKLLEIAMKKLAHIDRSLDHRLGKVTSLTEDAGRIKKECGQMMDEVQVKPFTGHFSLASGIFASRN